MLGPSGSGKTTCLRLIAGFEQPTSGRIEIFGSRAEGVPPYRRNVNTVFQDYALFPHLNVLDNVAYGLMVKGVGKAERQREAEAALEMVKLPGYGARRPGQLSGGQRQRVALARALVNRPKVLLLDEPLGALDLKLRENMQEELKTLQKSLGITFVFVTHDQGEALSMANRVAVFNDGRIMQVGSPEDIYQRPNSRFVADFVGSSNVLPPDFVARHGGQRRWASLRPEAVRISSALGWHRGHRRFSLLSRRHDAARSRCRGPAHQCAAARRPAPAGRRSVRPHRLHAAGPASDGRPGMSTADIAFRVEPPGAILPDRGGIWGHLSDTFWRKPRLLLLLMLAPPVLWLGIVYLGSLFALLAAELLLDRRVLRPDQPAVHAEDLWRPAAAVQHRHHHAHGRHGGAGHAGIRRRRLSDRLLRGPLRARQMEGAVLSRRHAAAVVELSRQDLRLEAHPRQGRHPHLVLREAASDVAARRLAVAAHRRRQFAVASPSPARSSSSSMSGCPS